MDHKKFRRVEEGGCYREGMNVKRGFNLLTELGVGLRKKPSLGRRGSILNLGDQRGGGGRLQLLIVDHRELHKEKVRCSKTEW